MLSLLFPTSDVKVSLRKNSIMNVHHAHDASSVCMHDQGSERQEPVYGLWKQGGLHCLVKNLYNNKQHNFILNNKHYSKYCSRQFSNRLIKNLQYNILILWHYNDQMTNAQNEDMVIISEAGHLLGRFIYLWIERLSYETYNLIWSLYHDRILILFYIHKLSWM